MAKYVAVYGDITDPRNGKIPTYWADLDKCEKKWTPEGGGNGEKLYLTPHGHWIMCDYIHCYWLDIVEAIPWLYDNGFADDITEDMFSARDKCEL